MRKHKFANRNSKGCFKSLLDEAESMGLNDLLVWNLNKLHPKTTQTAVRSLNTPTFRLGTKVLDGKLFVIRMR